MGWRGWSLDYVIPSVCVLAMIVMAVGAKLLKIGVRDLIIYLFIDAIFGLIPAIFYMWLVKCNFPINYLCCRKYYFPFGFDFISRGEYESRIK